MRTSGHRLFDKPGLGEALLEFSARLVREAVFEVLLANPRSSKLQLRRAAFRAGFVEPLVLLVPAPAVMSPERRGVSSLEMTCAIPFEGDAWLFERSAPVWPLPHQVRGELQGDALILAADASRGDVAWLPAVLAGELQEIERILAAQAMLVACHNRDLHGRVGALIERIHPRVNQSALRELHVTVQLLEDDGPLALVMETIVKTTKLELWREWTRIRKPGLQTWMVSV